MRRVCLCYFLPSEQDREIAPVGGTFSYKKKMASSSPRLTDAEAAQIAAQQQLQDEFVRALSAHLTQLREARSGLERDLAACQSATDAARKLGNQKSSLPPVGTIWVGDTAVNADDAIDTLADCIDFKSKYSTLK